MNFAKFFKNTFFAEYLRVTTSEIQKQSEIQKSPGIPPGDYF